MTLVLIYGIILIICYCVNYMDFYWWTGIIFTWQKNKNAKSVRMTSYCNYCCVASRLQGDRVQALNLMKMMRDRIHQRNDTISQGQEERWM